MNPACSAVALSRAGFYRDRKALRNPAPRPQKPTGGARSGHFRALPAQHREQILSVLMSERFVDRSARQVYATLLDENIYLCSVRTMYRLLAQNGAVRERRNVRRHPAYTRPELKATGPNQVWTWDITKLKGPTRGVFYYLYVVIDIYSRFVVGWLLADRECQHLAHRLLQETCQNQKIEPGQLTIHADRGSAMKSKSVEKLLMDLGVDKSHGRPRVSNDNPYSESGFKTLKYSAGFPDQFASIGEAEQFCVGYFVWYNQEHHHTGIALLTPAQVHSGQAEAVLSARQATLWAAFASHPERFGHRAPLVERPASEVWINAPALSVSASPSCAGGA